MKVGDLVRIKYDGKARLVTKVEIEPLERDINKGTWFHLLGEGMTFRKEHLELISETR